MQENSNNTMRMRNCIRAGLIGIFTAIFLHIIYITNNLALQIGGFVVAPWMFYVLFPFGEAIGYFVVISLFQRIRILVEASRFAIVGFLNFVVDAGALAILSATTGIYSGVGIVPLNMVAATIAFLNSYYWNRTFTFQSRVDASVGEFGSFLFVSAIGVLINSAVVFAITTFVVPFNGITEARLVTLAKVAATFVSLFWNFFGYKFIVFQKREM